MCNAAHPDSATLSVPLAAVTAEAEQPYLWVVDPATSQVHRRSVKLGPYGDSRAPLLEGVDPQSWIVVAGVHLLLEGQKVRPVDRDNRTLPMQTAANP
jgi:multidrug efflux system membrane fusion protein